MVLAVAETQRRPGGMQHASGHLPAPARQPQPRDADGASARGGKRQRGGAQTAAPAAVSAEARALFETLFEQYHQQVYQYIFRMMSDADDALDFTQETFLRAYRGLPAVLAAGRELQARAWLYRIATNTCLDELRRRRLIRWQPWESFVSVFHPSQVATDDPARDVLRQEAAEEVQAVLDRMHPRYRVCLVLREYQGLSYQEIADATGCSAEAVKTALFRAREDFRRRYRQAHGAAPGERAAVAG